MIEALKCLCLVLEEKAGRKLSESIKVGLIKEDFNE